MGNQSPTADRAGQASGDISRVGKSYLFLLVLVPGMAVVNSLVGVVGKGQSLPLLGVSPAEIVRGAILALAVGLLAVARDRRIRVFKAAVTSLGALVVSTLVISVLAGGTLRGTGYDVAYAGRMLYGPALVLLSCFLFLRYGVTRRQVLSALAWYGAVSGALIVGLRFVGIGLATYGDYSVAFAGFFVSPNATGVAMMVALACAAHLALSRPSGVHYATTALTVGGLTLLGTRAALIAALVVPAAALFVHRRRVVERRGRLATLAGVGIGLVLIAGLGVSQYRVIAQDQFRAERFARLTTGDINRIRKLARALPYIAERPWYDQLLGEGAYTYRSALSAVSSEYLGEDFGLAEVDWVDILGSHGVLFALALYAFYLMPWFKLRHPPPDVDREFRWTVYLALALYLGHGSVAGHALVSPTPSGIIAPLVAYVWLGSNLAPSDRREADVPGL